MVDIYQAALWIGKCPPPVTNTEVNSCLVGLVYSKKMMIFKSLFPYTITIFVRKCLKVNSTCYSEFQ